MECYRKKEQYMTSAPIQTSSSVISEQITDLNQRVKM